MGLIAAVPDVDTLDSVDDPCRARCPEVVGSSEKMAKLMSFVRKVAASEVVTILVQGESGSGKDLIAKTLHYQSARRDRPFVAVNCSAIPETLMEAELFGHERGAFTDAKAAKKGLFELADGGTLFLDEIGEMSPFLQAKLLRVLEDQIVRRIGGVQDIQVDVRVIAASNRDLERAVKERLFREDLYYRLAIISLYLPPLRERREDIIPLADFFVDHYNRKFHRSVRGINEDTRRMLESYSWPGNVRELKNAIERAMILEDQERLRPEYLPVNVSRAHPEASDSNFGGRLEPGLALPGGRSLPALHIPQGGTSLEEIEHHLVMMALEETGNNQTRAAHLLDISRDALRYKMKKFGLMHLDSSEN